MGSSSSSSSSLSHYMFFVSILLLHMITSVASSSNDHHYYSNESPNAIFVFGDSTVDPGNNNYINTIAKSNFLPYGRDLIPDHMPTGRFTNGKLITDFIASYLGIKELVPPYLDTTLGFQELMTGVSFASAGSGYDPLTSKIPGVIPMQKQLDYFREYKSRLQVVIGMNKTEDHIKRAIFIISAGTNDFIINYFSDIPIRRLSFTINNYQNFVIKKAREFLQGLWDLGARRIMIVGLPPIGCLPMIITFRSDSAMNILKRECVDKYSAVTNDYNRKFQDELVSIQQSFVKHEGLIAYIDIYNPLQEIIDNYNEYGFEERRTGCCGTGVIEMSYLCNPKAMICSDASKYIFWDVVHPSEKAYQILFNNAFRKTVDHHFLAHR